ncbi:MAG TPA: hypothetical protein DCQ98_09170 [Planctomycetaceae bacterium]|nr:hypothetical protein [Planctomycetaceae bacterium]HRF00560.1 lysophospholipase [Pirellulaceae bacterium]
MNAPPSPPVLVVIHGLGEHAGRYRDVAAEVERVGWRLWAEDLPGHGAAAGRRGDADYDALLEQVAASWERAASVGTPRSLWGHSFGGNLVANRLLRRGSLPGLDRVLLTGPMFLTATPPPRFKQWLADVMPRIWPTLTIATGLDPHGISTDPAAVEAYRADPLTHHRISARLGKGMLDSGRWALEHARRWDQATGGVPLLVLHGADDPITSCDASRRFVEQAGERARFEAWAGARHELHHERDRRRFVERLIDWIGRGAEPLDTLSFPNRSSS